MPVIMGDMIMGDSKEGVPPTSNLSVAENVYLHFIHCYNIDLASKIILLTWPIILLNPAVSNVLCN